MTAEFGQTSVHVTGVAYWDEFAPISDEWGEGDDGKRRPTGRKTLDTGGQWGKMPRVMLAKCSEAQAILLRPLNLSALYEGAELDRAQAEDLTPSETITRPADARAAVADRRYIGTSFSNCFPTARWKAFRSSKVADRVIETVKAFSVHDQIRWFESANLQPLREFWARAPSDRALEVKKVMEACGSKLLAEVQQQGDGRPLARIPSHLSLDRRGDGTAWRFHNIANATFVVGETYAGGGPRPVRGLQRHGHYFAALAELAQPTRRDRRALAHGGALRKWLLIRAGYRDERTLVCATKAEAQRLALSCAPWTITPSSSFATLW